VRRGKGDHDIWHGSIAGRNITVDGEIRIRHVARGCRGKKRPYEGALWE
jgi:ubiquinone biosynthesis protein Coq4